MKFNSLLLMQNVVFAAVNLGNYPVDDTKINKDGSSVKYEATTNFKTCSCDMTANTCDSFCCCDKDCPKVSNIFKFLRHFIQILNFL